MKYAVSLDCSRLMPKGDVFIYCVQSILRKWICRIIQFCFFLFLRLTSGKTLISLLKCEMRLALGEEVSFDRQFGWQFYSSVKTCFWLWEDISKQAQLIADWHYCWSSDGQECMVNQENLFPLLLPCISSHPADQMSRLFWTTIQPIPLKSYEGSLEAF